MAYQKIEQRKLNDRPTNIPKYQYHAHNYSFYFSQIIRLHPCRSRRLPPAVVVVDSPSLSISICSSSPFRNTGLNPPYGGRLGHEDTMSFAKIALTGDLAKLKRLRANGCPWDEQACYNAAFGGHLDTLKWLHTKGCPWLAHRALVNASLNKQYSTINWICDQM